MGMMDSESRRQIASICPSQPDGVRRKGRHTEFGSQAKQLQNPAAHWVWPLLKLTSYSLPTQTQNCPTLGLPTR